MLLDSCASCVCVMQDSLCSSKLCGIECVREVTIVRQPIILRQRIEVLHCGLSYAVTEASLNEVGRHPPWQWFHGDPFTRCV